MTQTSQSTPRRLLAILRQRRELLLFSALIVGGQGAGVIANTLLAKQLGPRDYAPVALLFSTTALLVVLALFGLNKYLNREIVEGKFNVSVILSAALFSSLAYSLLYLSGSRLLDVEFFYFYGLLSVIAIYLATTMQVLFRKLAIALALGFANFVKLLSAVLLILLAVPYRSLLELFSAVLLATVLLVVTAQGLRQRWQVPLLIGVEQLRGAAPFLVSMLMYFTYYQSSILVLGYFGLDEVLANFSVALTIYGASTFVPQLYYHKYRVSHFYALDKAGRIQFVKRHLPLVVVIGVVSALAGWLVIWALVAFYFDGEYRLAQAFFTGMTLAVAMRCISSLFDLYCHSATLASRRTLILVVAALANLGVNLLLIPVYGAYVVVWATLLAESLVLLGNVYLYRQSVNADLEQV